MAQAQTAMIFVSSATRERAVCRRLDVWSLYRALVNWRVVHGVQVRAIQMLVTLDHVVLRMAMLAIVYKFKIRAYATLWVVNSTQENRAQTILA